jgi:hypothetical protein
MGRGRLSLALLLACASVGASAASAHAASPLGLTSCQTIEDVYLCSGLA